MLRTVHVASFITLASAALLTATASASDQLYTSGLVARWTFDDSTGKDAAGTSDMTLIGSPAMLPSPMGKALANSASDYAVADAPELNVNGWTGITVSVWVQPVAFTTYGNILGRGSDSAGGAYIFYAPAVNSWDSQFNINFSATQGEGTVFGKFTPSKPPHPEIGRWYHLAGTYDGQSVRTYVNGEPDSEKRVSTPGHVLWEPAGCRTYIGTSYALPYRNWADQHFKGAFDEVAIWNRALAPAEIRQLFLANTQQVSWAASSARENTTPARNIRHYTPDARVPPPTPATTG